MGTFPPRLFKTACAAACALTLLLPGARAGASEHGATVVGRYADALQRSNGTLSAASRYALAQRLLLLASYYSVDPALLVAIVTVESSWRSHAVSPVGALGYGQLMPGTAAVLRVDALEPYENLDGTARYLRRLLNRFSTHAYDERVRLTIASYNAGPGAIDRYGGIPPYRETQAYVEKVLRWAHRYGALARGRAFDVESVIARAAPPAHKRAPSRRTVAAPALRTAGKAPVRLAAAATPYRSPYLDAPDPNAYETPAPETVVSAPAARRKPFLSRLFGRRSSPASP